MHRPLRHHHDRHIFKTAVNIYTFAAQYCKNTSCCSRLVTNGLCFEDTNNPAVCSLQLQDGFTSISPTLTSSRCKESEWAAIPDGNHVQLQLNEWRASALIHIRVFRIKTSQLSEINWPEGAKNYGSLFAWRICWFSQKWQVACQKYRLMDIRISCSPRSGRDCVVTLTCRRVRAVCALAFSSYSAHQQNSGRTARRRQREEEPRDEKEEKKWERETNWLFGG